jgi:hypothetical protein
MSQHRTSTNSGTEQRTIKSHHNHSEKRTASEDSRTSENTGT